MSESSRDDRPVPKRAVQPTAPSRAIGPMRALLDEPTGVASQATRHKGRSRTFAASVGWTLLTAIVPGLGLVRTRWRASGLFLTAIAVGLAATIGLAALVARGALFSWAVNPAVLRVIWVGLIAFGALWIISIIATHLLTRPRPPTGWQRVGGAALVGVLAFAVAIPTFVGARSVYDTASLIGTVFTDADEPGASPAPTFGNAIDPWANKPRLNILVLGADTGADRVGTRTDTVIVLSINTRTGDAVMYSLPRQTLRMPFPKGTALYRRWPNGFYLGGDPGESMLNAMYAAVPAVAPEAIPAAKNPGAKVLQLSVGEALGLQIDYYAMVDLNGFVQLVNALGGVTVNISKPVPVGGKNPTNIGGSDGFPPDRWLAPGPNQHLNGYDALWFARGRYNTDDYERMSRQRCVIQAVSRQANLTTIVANYEALTKTGSDIVQTDVPNSAIPALLELALKVRAAPLRSISFENDKDGFSTTHPDWDIVRERVAASLDPDTASASPSASASASATPKKSTATTRAPSVTPSATPATPSVAPDGTHDVADECAYDPNAWTVTIR